MQSLVIPLVAGFGEDEDEEDGDEGEGARRQAEAAVGESACGGQALGDRKDTATFRCAAPQPQPRQASY